ncbi:HNH endonuclease [Bifidobacterium sp. 82T24]|uniref:HNH endonuclease family protein n=1 Tax=Bifidobacterium pluvialisilvae TaxID=2834436 RepID=UPI001C57BC29|nr:HNH endonuclease family protein [Bifidobacterium pluvialisilvae]MBW3087596.1 HNH endonuclease [Bifidobacterium pluvialisilvae]
MGRRRRGFRAASALERFLVLLVLAVVAGVTAGLVLPQVSETAGKVTGEYTATGDAAATLGTLAVADGRRPAGTYQRSAFGFRQYDPDGNGCDSRNDVLARDLKDVRYANAERCKVQSGTLDDPYTGRTIEFVRGQSTSAKVQIDHVVALNNAWKSGADQWSTKKRYEFSNDPYNLLAVDGPANEDKGDADASVWLPPNTRCRCDYVARQIGVKAKYGLSVTSREKQAMLRVLHDCPGQTVPRQ